MKRLVLAVIVILLAAGIAAAQSTSGDLGSTPSDSSYKFTSSRNSFSLFNTTTTTSTNPGTSAAASPFATPAPSPAPRFYYGNSEDYRFQLGLGYEYVHFRSTPFNANLNGVQTSLTYYLNDWAGVEGNIVAAFGTKNFGDTSKYLLYTGGVRVAWRDTRRKYEPWMHALVGGLHMIPQVAVGGQNGFAFQVGAGVDFRYNSRVSFRAGGDYVRSQLYSESQNNIQFGGGAVFHF